MEAFGRGEPWKKAVWTSGEEIKCHHHQERIDVLFTVTWSM